MELTVHEFLDQPVRTWLKYQVVGWVDLSTSKDATFRQVLRLFLDENIITKSDIVKLTLHPIFNGAYNNDFNSLGLTPTIIRQNPKLCGYKETASIIRDRTTGCLGPTLLDTHLYCLKDDPTAVLMFHGSIAAYQTSIRTIDWTKGGGALGKGFYMAYDYTTALQYGCVQGTSSTSAKFSDDDLDVILLEIIVRKADQLRMIEMHEKTDNIPEKGDVAIFGTYVAGRDKMISHLEIANIYRIKRDKLVIFLNKICSAEKPRRTRPASPPKVPTRVPSPPKISTRAPTPVKSPPVKSPPVKSPPKVSTRVPSPPKISTRVPSPPKISARVPSPPKISTRVPSPPKISTRVPSPPKISTRVPTPPKISTRVPTPPKISTRVPTPPKVSTRVPSPSRALVPKYDIFPATQDMSDEANQLRQAYQRWTSNDISEEEMFLLLNDIVDVRNKTTKSDLKRIANELLERLAPELAEKIFRDERDDKHVKLNEILHMFDGKPGAWFIISSLRGKIPEFDKANIDARIAAWNQRVPPAWGTQSINLFLKNLTMELTNDIFIPPVAKYIQAENPTDLLVGGITVERLVQIRNKYRRLLANIQIYIRRYGYDSNEYLFYDIPESIIRPKWLAKYVEEQFRRPTGRQGREMLKHGTITIEDISFDTVSLAFIPELVSYIVFPEPEYNPEYEYIRRHFRTWITIRTGLRKRPIDVPASFVSPKYPLMKLYESRFREADFYAIEADFCNDRLQHVLSKSVTPPSKNLATVTVAGSDDTITIVHEVWQRGSSYYGVIFGDKQLDEALALLFNETKLFVMQHPMDFLSVAYMSATSEEIQIRAALHSKTSFPAEGVKIPISILNKEFIQLYTLAKRRGEKYYLLPGKPGQRKELLDLLGPRSALRLQDRSTVLSGDLLDDIPKERPNMEELRYIDVQNFRAARLADERSADPMVRRTRPRYRAELSRFFKPKVVDQMMNGYPPVGNWYLFQLWNSLVPERSSWLEMTPFELNTAAAGPAETVIAIPRKFYLDFVPT